MYLLFLLFLLFLSTFHCFSIFYCKLPTASCKLSFLSTVLNTTSAAILILLRDLLMLIERICLSAKPKIHKLALLKQSEFIYGFVLSKTTISYGSVDVVKQNHMPILVSNQWAVNTKTFKNPNALQ